ncbi:hypothetical protein C8J56DRAFT_1065432 [Mycena floridula]|nr:hypothetical protein C8J56DRAFT_1065432 [Mycena floridula]
MSALSAAAAGVLTNANVETLALSKSEENRLVSDAMNAPGSLPVDDSLTMTSQAEDDMEVIIDGPQSLVSPADMALAMSGPLYAPYVPEDLPAFVVFGTPAQGPWFGDVPYSTVPQCPLVIDAEMEIMPGSCTLGINSTKGVPGNAWKGYSMLGAALTDFNKLLSWGMVEIRYE